MRGHLAAAIDIDANIDAAEIGGVEPDLETALAASCRGGGRPGRPWPRRTGAAAGLRLSPARLHRVNRLALVPPRGSPKVDGPPRWQPASMRNRPRRRFSPHQ